MRSFTDNDGRKWDLAIDINAAKRARSLCGVDLLSAGGEMFTKLAADPILLVDVLYAVLKPQADHEKITDEQFGAAMAGDAIDHATTALVGEIIDFFPSRRRQMLHAIRTKATELATATDDLAETMIRGLNMAAILNDSTHGNVSTKQPGESELTPAPLPSES